MEYSELTPKITYQLKYAGMYYMQKTNKNNIHRIVPKSHRKTL